MNEEKLVKLAQNYNKEAFSELVNMYKKDLYVIAKAKLDNNVDIDDAIQETLFDMYKNINQLKNPANFKAWIIRILINNCNNILREKTHKLPFFEEIDNIVDESDHYKKIDNNFDFFEMIDFLPSEDKLLLTMRYCSELDIKDISKIVNIREGTIRMRLSRIISKIKNNYRGDI